MQGKSTKVSRSCKIFLENSVSEQLANDRFTVEQLVQSVIISAWHDMSYSYYIHLLRKQL